MKPKAHRLPFVFVNFAMTADGKIAFANHHFDPFTSRRDADHMLELRATADAVMAGARTVDSGPVTMGPGPAKYRKLRLRRGLAEYNLRILVTGSGSINGDAEIFKHRFSPIIILTSGRATKVNLDRMRAVADSVKICGKTEIDFHAALRWLRAEWGVKRLLCEGGGELHDALLREDLVDELHLTVAPKIFGGRTSPTIAEGKGAASLSEATPFRVKSLDRVGDELYAVFGRSEKPPGMR